MGLQANDALPTGHRLHWYEIQSILGYGGFGITYLGRDTNLNQSVAIKEFFPQNYVQRLANHQVKPGDGMTRDFYHWGLERFLDEARTLARFRHPHIVRVLSVFEEFGTAYMVMELERGYSLGEAIKLGYMHDESKILDMCIPMLGGLHLIHQAGFIHRDIKPGNILIRDDQTPVLIDFGSARQPHPDELINLTAVVTKGYAPFEQYDAGNEEQQGPWSDIYGLAATLYHAVTRSVPVDALTRTMALLNESDDPLTPASHYAAGLYSDKLLNAIDAGLIVRASERPQAIDSWRLLFPEHHAEFHNDPQVRTEAHKIPSRRETGKRDTHEPTLIVRSSPAHTGMTKKSSNTTFRNTVSQLAPAACADWNFLVVDDEVVGRSLASRVLSKLGAQNISTAASAQLALACLQENPGVDVIVCDLVMPDTDGIEFLRQLAEARVFSGIILVGDGDNRLLTAAEGIARSHRLHLLGSLNKPLNPRELATLLQGMQTYREHSELDRQASVLSDDELRDTVEAGLGPKLVYLPTISLQNHELIGAEALSRWPGANQDSASVLRTIARIEALGLAERFSQQVFGQALAQAGAWRAEGLDMGISVNVFAGMLNQVNLPNQIVELAQAEGLDPASVTLEVNEVRFADECAAPMEILTRLRLRKVGLSLDDFGTGTSTFERLRQLPVSEIKIHRSIIQTAATDATSRAILESSVALAKRLDLKVVAVGVEDQDTLEMVTSIGCYAAQGYLISPPMDGEVLEDWASDWQSNSSLESAPTVVPDLADALD